MDEETEAYLGENSQKFSELVRGRAGTLAQAVGGYAASSIL